ncbi:MAG: AsmA-like C-terminal region-containing protein [Opitutales bacterium]
MMAFTARLKRLLAGIGRPCVHCLLWAFSLFLALTLTVGLVLAISLYRTERLPFPRFLMPLVQAPLNDILGPFETEAARITWDFSGLIVAENVRLVDARQPDQPLVTAERLAFDLDLPPLLFGRIHFEAVDIIDGTLICPAVHSPGGVAGPAISEIDARLTSDGRQLQVGLLRARSGNLRLHASGTWREPLTGLAGLRRQPSDEAAGDPSLNRRRLQPYFRGLALLLRQHERLAWMESPVLRLRLSQGDRPEPRIGVSVSAKALDTGKRFSTRELQGAGRLVYRDGRWQPDGPARLRGAGLGWEPDWLGTGWAATLPLNDRFRLAGPMEVVLDRLTWRTYALRDARGTLDLTAWPEATYEAAGNLLGKPVRLTGRGHLINGSGEVRAEGSLGLGRLETIPIWPEVAQEAFAQVEAGLTDPAWQVTATFDPNYRFREARVAVTTGPATVRSLSWDRLTGRGRVTPEGLSIEEFAIAFDPGATEVMRGQLDIAFASRKMNLYIGGTGYPAKLEPWMPDFWPKIMEPFTWGDRLPYADFQVQAVLGQRYQTTWFGYCRFPDIGFQGVPLEEMSGRTWGMAKYSELYDIQAKHRDGGLATGSLAWTFLHQYRGIKSTRFAVTSTLPLKDTGRILAEPVRAVIDRFEAETPPRLTADGVWFTRFTPGLRPDNRFSVTAVTDRPVTAFTLPLDSLDLALDWTWDRLRVTPLTAGFAEGSATGSLTFTRPKPEAPLQLDLDISIEDARSSEVVRRLPHAARLREEKALAEPDPEDRSHLSGQFQGSGPAGELDGFAGEGSVRLEDPDLGRIRLFGVLSEVFYIGSLALDTLEADFRLQDTVLTFPDLRVTGPATEIEAEGEYRIRQDSLFFDVRLFLGNLEKTPLFSIVTSVFRPVSYALEANLWGSLKDPRWRLKIDPRNLIADPSDLRKRQLPRSPESSFPVEGRPTDDPAETPRPEPEG